MGVAVLRVPEARRLGNGRVELEINKMGMKKNEKWSREARDTIRTA